MGLLTNVVSGSAPAWTIDSTSSKAVPANTTEWNAFNTAAGIGMSAPTSIWLMQDSSGNATDVNALAPLTPTGTVKYSQPLTGWTRLGMGWNANGAHYLSDVADSDLPEVSTQSALYLAYSQVSTTPAGDRMLFLAGDSNGIKVLINSSNQIKGLWNAGSATTGPSAVGTGVRPIILQHNVTSKYLRVYTDQDVITIPWATGTSSLASFFAGGAVETTAAQLIAYMAMWKGSAAEQSPYRIKQLLTALGYTPAWSPWKVDATSSKGIPQDTGEIHAICTAAGITATPLAIYGMQEASGNVLDKSNNSRDLTATNVTYANTISGWSSKSIHTIYGVHSKLVTAGTGIPNLNSAPATLISWIYLGSHGAQMTVKRLGTGYNLDATIEIDGTPKFQVGSYDSRTAGSTLSLPRGPFPLALVADSITAKQVRVYSDQELVLCDDNDTPVGTEIRFGGDNIQSYYAAAADIMWSAAFSKAFSALEYTAFCTAAGWTGLPTQYPNSVIKTGGTSSYDGEASTQLLGTGTVRLQFTVGAISSGAYIAGFAPAALNYASGAYAGLNNDTGTMYWVETAGTFGSLGSTVKGDLWEIKRTVSTGVIEYFKNTVLVRTSVITMTGSILVDTSHRFAGYGPNRVRVLDGSAAIVPLTWATTNVTVY